MKSAMIISKRGKKKPYLDVLAGEAGAKVVDVEERVVEILCGDLEKWQEQGKFFKKSSQKLEIRKHKLDCQDSCSEQTTGRRSPGRCRAASRGSLVKIE